MAIKSLFMGSVNRDRVYKESDFAQYFALFIANGIYNRPGELVTIANEDMTVNITSGALFENGYQGISDGDFTLDMPLPETNLPRIDRISFRHDYTERRFKFYVLKGQPASNPQPPAIVREPGTYYDTVIAQVLREPGELSVKQANITDTRLNSEICGIVALILEQPETKALFLQIQAELQRVIETDKAEFDAFIESVRDILDEDAAGRLLNFIVGNTQTANAEMLDGALVITPTAGQLGDSYEVKFDVPDGGKFKANMPIVIAGTRMAEFKSIGGKKVGGGAFDVGAPVTIIRRGASAFLAGGGGGGGGDMNIAVVGGSTRPNPEDYDQQVIIWVPSAELEPQWIIQPGTPTMQNGGVWLPVLNSTHTVVDIYEGGNIRVGIGTPEIYQGGVWAPQTDAEVYAGGVWAPIATVLYDSGVIFVPITFIPYSATYYAKNQDGLLQVYGGGTSTASGTSYLYFDALDVTAYTKLYVDIESYTGTPFSSNTWQNVYLGTAPTSSQNSAGYGLVFALNQYNTRVEFDISAISGSRFIHLRTMGYPGGSMLPLLKVKKVFMQ